MSVCRCGILGRSERLESVNWLLSNTSSSRTVNLSKPSRELEGEGREGGREGGNRERMGRGGERERVREGKRERERERKRERERESERERERERGGGMTEGIHVYTCTQFVCNIHCTTHIKPYQVPTVFSTHNLITEEMKGKGTLHVVPTNDYMYSNKRKLQ